MLITLLTDFGDRDGFVGQMKGVIYARAPQAQVVDLAHHIPPGDVRHASHVLAQAAPLFPGSSVHVAVVDPGVGTSRRAVALAVGDQLYLGPDNGVFSDVLALGDAHAVLLDNEAFFRHPVSPTFHGRDIFASVAAHLAAGIPLAALGPNLDPTTLVRLAQPEPEVGVDALRGVVVTSDRFGNAITNLPAALLAQFGPAEHLSITAGDHGVGGLRTTFGEVERGQPVAVIGSSGRLEIAVNGGSAAQKLGLQPGAAIVVTGG